MKKIVQKFFAKILNSSLVKHNPYVIDNFQHKLELELPFLIQKNINQKYSYTKIGKNSKFYEETTVQNGSSKIENINIGDNSHIRGELLVQKYGGAISIGNYCFLGIGSKIWSGERIQIGNNVLISHHCNIIDTNSHEINYMERAIRSKEFLENGPWDTKGSILTSPITIEDDVWISFNVTILKGVTIGKGSIVAAGSVVTKSIPPFSLVVGNPAKVIKQL